MTSSNAAALLIGKLSHTTKEWKSLSSILNLKHYETGSREAFLAALRAGAYDDVVAISRSNESTSVTGPFDHALVSALPPSVRFITHNGAGYDNIDVAACAERGIAVSSTPIAVNEATADVAMFLILGALRRVTVPLLAVRKGEWRGDRFGLGHDPEKKVLGVLGMGGIGQAVAHRARAFGMQIHYHNRHRLPVAEEHGATYMSFADLLRTADVLSLNLALNASTRHIIGAAQFAAMKDGVILINTARGPVVDEAALVDALASGKVFAAGLDVYEREPEIHPALLENENVLLLPHIGTATWETQREMELLVLENLKSAVLGKGLLTQVPEQRKQSKM